MSPPSIFLFVLVISHHYFLSYFVSPMTSHQIRRYISRLLILTISLSY